MPYTTIHHQQQFHSPKYNTIKSMAGLLPLAPHHDSLQYIHHVSLMQRGQNWGVTQVRRGNCIYSDMCILSLIYLPFNALMYITTIRIHL